MGKMRYTGRLVASVHGSAWWQLLHLRRTVKKKKITVNIAKMESFVATVLRNLNWTGPDSLKSMQIVVYIYDNCSAVFIIRTMAFSKCRVPMQSWERFVHKVKSDSRFDQINMRCIPLYSETFNQVPFFSV